MKISWSLSAMYKGVHLPFDIGSDAFKLSVIGMPVHLENDKYIGRVTGIDVESDLIYADVPNVEYSSNVVEARGCNICEFKIME